MRNETTKSHFLRYRNSNPAFIGPRKFSVNTCMAATTAKLAIYIQIRLKKRIINTKTMEKRLKLIVHHPCKSDLETVFPRIKHRVWHGQLPFARKNASYVHFDHTFLHKNYDDCKALLLLLSCAPLSLMLTYWTGKMFGFLKLWHESNILTIYLGWVL